MVKPVLPSPESGVNERLFDSNLDGIESLADSTFLGDWDFETPPDANYLREAQATMGVTDDYKTWNKEVDVPDISSDKFPTLPLDIDDTEQYIKKKKREEWLARNPDEKRLEILRAILPDQERKLTDAVGLAYFEAIALEPIYSELYELPGGQAKVRLLEVLASDIERVDIEGGESLTQILFRNYAVFLERQKVTKYHEVQIDTFNTAPRKSRENQRRPRKQHLARKKIHSQEIGNSLEYWRQSIIEIIDKNDSEAAGRLLSFFEWTFKSSLEAVRGVELRVNGIKGSEKGGWNGFVGYVTGKTDEVWPAVSPVDLEEVEEASARRAFGLSGGERVVTKTLVRLKKLPLSALPEGEQAFDLWRSQRPQK